MVRDPVHAVFAALMLLSAATARGQADDAPRVTGSTSPDPVPYTFSDELGGFSILTISGAGTRDDPVRIVQRFATASPATLVIRATRPLNLFGPPGMSPVGNLHMVLDITNDSGIPWIGLELELQEQFEEPSIFGDGLSFDQRHLDTNPASSSAFSNAHYDFEPYDRLLFEDGALDPRNHAEFRFLITDPTPTTTFYVRLDPRIPAS